MKTEYSPAFIKVLKALMGSTAFDRVKKLAFEEVPRVIVLNDLKGLKRFRGPEEAYRIRIGDYRGGFFLNGQTVVFARVLHRKEIYRYFP